MHKLWIRSISVSTSNSWHRDTHTQYNPYCGDFAKTYEGITSIVHGSQFFFILRREKLRSRLLYVFITYIFNKYTPQGRQWLKNFILVNRVLYAPSRLKYFETIWEISFCNRVDRICIICNIYDILWVSVHLNSQTNDDPINWKKNKQSENFLFRCVKW